MKDFDIKLRLIRIFSDFVSVNLAWIVGYYMRMYLNNFIYLNNAESVFILPDINNLISFFIISSFSFIILALFFGLYNFDAIYGPIGSIFRISFLICIWGLLIVAFYAIWKHQLFFSRILLFFVIILSITFLSFFRFIIKIIEKYLLIKGLGSKKVHIIGEGKIVEKIKSTLKNLPQYKILSISESFQENDNFKGIDMIWYTGKNEELKNKIVNYCQINQIGFSFYANTEGILVSRLKTTMIGKLPLLTIISTPIYGWGKFLKRNLDIIVGIILLVLLSPIFLIVSVLIKIDSPGPIFYKSKRVGKNGKHFGMYKFRSMITDAEKLKESLMDKNNRKGPLFKIKDDPRITKFGKFLRRFSIDELPQIWNVIKGEMSFVGPRAHLPEEVKKYTPLQMRVFTIKPGITGLAQINGRSNLDFEEEIRLDLQYIVYWSILLDIQIVIQTPFILLKGEGAD